MFDHVTIRAADRAASERFYATVLRELGLEQTYAGDDLAEWDEFSVAQAGEGEPVTRRLHVAFAAASQDQVRAFWRAGTDAGHPDDGPPGQRPQYGPDYFGAFLLDPDGNSAEAVHHDAVPASGRIDHLWIRVAEVARSKRFYETVAPQIGARLARDTPELAQFKGRDGSFSVVSGTPTEHVHLAFPATSDATVEAFHRVATAAGHRDNGAPGERAVYHTGYYAAFVLDPDGNNVEVVNHNRAG